MVYVCCLLSLTSSCLNCFLVTIGFFGWSYFFLETLIGIILAISSSSMLSSDGSLSDPPPSSPESFLLPEVSRDLSLVNSAIRPFLEYFLISGHISFSFSNTEDGPALKGKDIALLSIFSSLVPFFYAPLFLPGYGYCPSFEPINAILLSSRTLLGTSTSQYIRSERQNRRPMSI